RYTSLMSGSLSASTRSGSSPVSKNQDLDPTVRLAAHTVAADLLHRVMLTKSECLALVVDEHQLLAERRHRRRVFTELFAKPELENIEECAPGEGPDVAVDCQIGGGGADGQLVGVVGRLKL